MGEVSITQKERENMKLPLFYARTQAHIKIECVRLNKIIHF